MAYQIINSLQSDVSSSRKRRMDDDSEAIVLNENKRYFDLHTQFSPVEVPKHTTLPAITFASPDYMPPPRSEVPLWLQPVPKTTINTTTTTYNSNNASSPATEDESEDDGPLLTPLFLQQQEKNTNEYWGDNMAIDEQWQ
ncbi:hypothetical protein RMCBS344292_06384 [Rhizopus microsporus]|nr:hypothetical protein RMCBS344292_06384 [Rhizopus microsporus]